MVILVYYVLRIYSSAITSKFTFLGHDTKTPLSDLVFSGNKAISSSLSSLLIGFDELGTLLLCWSSFGLEVTSTTGVPKIKMAGVPNYGPKSSRFTIKITRNNLIGPKGVDIILKVYFSFG